MAELNGKKFEDWEEYIYDKFPSKEFVLSEDKDTSSTNVISVISKNPSSKTKIVFDFPTADLCRVCFYNPDSPFHNTQNDQERLRSLLYSDYELTSENLKNTNDYLEIPLHYGWTEKATYYKEQLIKSELLYHNGNTCNEPYQQDIS